MWKTKKDYLDSFPGMYLSSSPSTLSFLFHFGFVIFSLLVLQISSGLILSMFYKNTGYSSFSCLLEMTQDSKFFWFLRAYHANSASAIFFCIYMHIFRGLSWKSYVSHSEAPQAWVSGIILFLLMMAAAFVGYVLPWGQMSFWGATVITMFLSALPWGEELDILVWGSFSIQDSLVGRFFSIHYWIPFLSLLFVMLHFEAVHYKGSTPTHTSMCSERVGFYPLYFFKDFFFLFLLFLFLTPLLLFSPYLLGDPENFIEANNLLTPHNIQPEWYFLPFYAILRSIPSKVGGLAFLVFSIAAIFFLGVSNSGRGNSSKLFLLVFSLSFVLLGYVGSLHVSSGTIFCGLFFTGLYFLSVLLYMMT